jgi:putative DNA primase/helicase
MPVKQSPQLRAALWYARRFHWHVFPIRPRDKAPLTAGGFYNATTDQAQIRHWWQQWPDANVGIACGASGLVVIDIDAKNGAGGLESWADLRQELGSDIDDTPTVETPTGGLHLYYAAIDRSIRNSTSQLANGIDVRGEGGYVVAPPSEHPEGGTYNWALNCGPHECELDPLPEGIAERLRGPQKLVLDSDSSNGSGDAIITTGQRNATLTSLAGTMRRRGMTCDAIVAALLAENSARCSPPLHDDEVTRIALSVARYDPVLDPEHLTDMGNSRRLVHLAKDDLRYVPQWGWLWWDGRRWARDTSGAAMRCARETVQAIRSEATRREDEAERAALEKWAKTSESLARIRAMVELAQSELEFVADVEQFDTDPMLLNCLNGTIDLRTGRLRPHSRADYITKLAPVEYVPDAAHPIWTRYLQTATDGDAEFAAYLQRACGYSLTGLTDEETVFLLLGDGRTGKTTLAEGMLAIMGEYGIKVAFDSFLERTRSSVGQAREDIARMVGARLAVACEAADHQRLNEVMLKELSGGDRVTARFLYRDSFTFVPRVKIWLATNHAPRVRDDDNAIWRRLRRLPFEHVIPPEEQDENVKKSITNPAEAGKALLAWAVKGCLAWQQLRLGMPEIIERKTKELRAEFDPLAEFFQDCCIFGPRYEADARALRETYEEWARENGVSRPVGDRDWSRRLKAKGCERLLLRRGGVPTRMWSGIGLIMAVPEGLSAEIERRSTSTGATQIEMPTPDDDDSENVLNDPEIPF